MMKSTVEVTKRNAWQRSGLRERGITMIELMIVVVVIAVLSAFAIPAYTEYLKKGYRADARAVMLETAHFMQRYYSVNNTYAGGNVQLPNNLRVSPAQGSPRYMIRVDENGVNGFTVSATPDNSMAGDRCGTLTLTETGQRDASGTSEPGCW